MIRKLLWSAGILTVLLVGYFVVRGNKGSDTASIMAVVKKGEFRVEIETTGELEAKNSVKIQAPTQLREYRVNNLTIQITIISHFTRY